MVGRDSDSFDVEDFLEHTITRRDLLRYGTALGATALGSGLLSACIGGTEIPEGAAPENGPVEAPKESAAVPTPRHETVILGQVSQVSHGVYNPFIPNVDYATGFGQVVKEYFYYLNLAKPTDNLISWQSTGWEYENDFNRIVLHLDPKCEWNDGVPFTSKDIAFTIDYFRKHEELQGNRGVVDPAKKVQTPDEHTVVIDLTERNTRFHYNFICAVVSAGFLAIPEHIWSDQKDPTLFKNDPPVFTGPYKLHEANRTLQYYVWEKNPDYWNIDRLDCKPNYVAYITTPAGDAAAQDFEHARYDQGGPFEQTRRMIADGHDEMIITSMIDPCLREFMVNCDPTKGILSDKRMRWALSCLIDREFVSRTIWPLPTAPAFYPWPDYPYLEKWEAPDILEKYQLGYNPERAAELLDEMGATLNSDGRREYDGEELDFTIICPTGNIGGEFQTCLLLVEQLDKVGISARVKALTGPGVFGGVVTNGDYDIRIHWGDCSTLDPGQSYGAYISDNYAPIPEPPLGGNDVRIKTTDFDEVNTKLNNAAPTSPDSKALFDEALDVFFDQLPHIPYIQTLYTHQSNTTYWTGWPTDDDLYMVPNNWWGQFMFVIGNIRPASEEQ